MNASGATEPELPVKLHLTNYKRFKSISLPLDKDLLIIRGPNGAGKTQLLYAFLIFFRGFNTYLEASACHVNKLEPSQISSKQVKALHLRDEAHYLFHPSFSDATSYGHFINHKTAESPCAQLVATLNRGAEVKMSLYANGQLLIAPEESDFTTSKKIQYAFMGADFHFRSGEERRDLPLTANAQHIRILASKLPEPQREMLSRHIHALFPSVQGVEIVSEEYSDHIWIHTNGTKLEVMVMGSALQKIVAALILLYFLVFNKRSLSDRKTQEEVLCRYYLLEEPEAYLYPGLASQFFSIVKSICDQNQVKLVVVSNSYDIWQFAPSDHILTLSETEPKFVEPSDNAASLARLLGVDSPLLQNARILIVDGSNDIEFLEHFWHLSAYGVQYFRQRALNISKDSKPRLIEMLGTANVPFAFIKDPEFATKSLLQTDDHTFYWELPCIESYLILHLVQTRYSETISKLVEFFKWGHFAYVDGLKQAIGTRKDSSGTTKENQLMQNPGHYFESLQKLNRLAEKPTFELSDWSDWVEIISVVHGHSFMGVLNLKTPDFIRSSTLTQEVQALLNQTVEPLRIHLRINF